MAEAKVTIADICGHDIAGDLQSEDRLNRPSPDITIEFVETCLGMRLPQWQRDIVEKLVTAPKMMPLPRHRMRLPPPLIFSKRGPTGK